MAVFRCISSNNSRRKNVASRKGKTMPSKKNYDGVPTPPDQVAYSQALSRGMSRDEAMAIARKRGVEVVAAKEAAARRAAEYRA